LATRPVDFRKGIDGLAGGGRKMFRLRSVLRGGLCVPVENVRTEIKLLVWDQTGMVLFTSDWRTAKVCLAAVCRTGYEDVQRADVGVASRGFGILAGWFPAGAWARPSPRRQGECLKVRSARF